MEDKTLSGKRVLVIEDEMLVLMAIEDMLTDLGCTSISVAGNLDRALALIASETYDCATLDLNLHGERSYPVAQALNDAGVPFAFATGYGEHGVDPLFAGHPVLNKPYTASQMAAVIATLLAKPEPAAVLA